MEQLERAQRYLERIRRLYSGVPIAWDDRLHSEDDIYSFFIHCYHVRDWLIHLNKLGIDAKEVDAFIDSRVCLRICADLCNGTKHCSLRRKTRTSEQPNITMRQHEGQSEPTPELKSSFGILASGRLIDALELAEDCMRAWDEYIIRLQASYTSAAKHVS